MANTVISTLTAQDTSTPAFTREQISAIEDTATSGVDVRIVHTTDGKKTYVSTSLADCLTATTAAYNGTARFFAITPLSPHAGTSSVILNVYNVIKAEEAGQIGTSTAIRKITMAGGQVFRTARALSDLVNDMNTVIA